jgi:hypothetical protein
MAWGCVVAGSPEQVRDAVEPAEAAEVERRASA